MNTHKSKRIAPSIYSITVKGRTFEIDGYTGEWKLFEITKGSYGALDRNWWETYPTKRKALADLERIMELK